MQMITEDKLMRLKSGTDIRGVAVQTETEEIELTDEVVEKICTAFVIWLRKKENKENLKIAVGHDSRISADRIMNAAIKAFKAEGVAVYDCGLSSTPAMFMSIVLDIKVDASLEITASHHPYQRNGLKFFTRNGGLEGGDVKDILHIAYSAELGSKEGSVIEYDFMSIYCEHLRNKIIEEVADGDTPLKG
ncbi:MAG: phosphomannomutase/phosphoglucomutase, partial [Eubacterium sp.]|nr:phosphomannomutase/phosphoglucomutase [Eubacterium sp.]